MDPNRLFKMRTGESISMNLGTYATAFRVEVVAISLLNYSIEVLRTAAIGDSQKTKECTGLIGSNSAMCPDVLG